MARGFFTQRTGSSGLRRLFDGASARIRISGTPCSSGISRIRSLTDLVVVPLNLVRRFDVQDHEVRLGVCELQAVCGHLKSAQSTLAQVQPNHLLGVWDVG